MTIGQILFSFEGRIGRGTWWAATIGVMVVNVVLQGIMAGVASGSSGGEGFAAILILLLLVPLIWISLAVSVKRWHDRGKSGWMVLVGLIPLIGAIWQLVECGILRGTVGSNEYGDDPVPDAA